MVLFELQDQGYQRGLMDTDRPEMGLDMLWIWKMDRPSLSWSFWIDAFLTGVVCILGDNGGCYLPPELRTKHWDEARYLK